MNKSFFLLLLMLLSYNSPSCFFSSQRYITAHVLLSGARKTLDMLHVNNLEKKRIVMLSMDPTNPCFCLSFQNLQRPA